MDPLNVKPYPVQADVIYSGGANTVQPGQVQLPQPLTNLLDIVSTSPLCVIEDFILKNSSVIHEKGFNGQRALHRACLRGDTAVVRLLLQHGADVNAGNDFDETPLHFACKRANLVVLRCLIEHGADVRAEDRAGKGVLHHAAHGGSILALHYLLDVYGLNPHVRDRNLSTPMHTVCIHGHIEAFNYLLKEERTDVLSRDAQGNTVMHLAALTGKGWMCWRLLEHCGYQILHERNAEGCTPLDLAKRGSATKYVDIVSMLTYYTRQSARSSLTQKLTGVNRVWYILLVSPFIVYPLCLLLTSCFTNRGPMMSVGLVLMIGFRTFQQHRINDISRMPNPAHASMFAAGMFYTLMCFYVVIMPTIFLSVGYAFIVTALVLTGLMVYIHVQLLKVDPGICVESRPKADPRLLYGISDIASGMIGPETFCTICEIVRPETVSHCRLCCRCHHQIDHHCLYLYRCIAVNNHRLFVLFTFVVMASMFMFEYSCIIYLRSVYPGQELFSWSLLSAVFATRPMIWSLFVLNGLSVVWTTFVLHTQITAVSKGRLRAYQSYRVRSWLSVRQRLMNVMHFFVNGSLYVRDEVSSP